MDPGCPGSPTRPGFEGWTLDLGNSSVGLVRHGPETHAASWPEPQRVPHESTPAPALLAALRAAPMRVGVAGRAPGSVPWLAELGPVLWVGHELPAPGEVQYDDPGEMGLDRRVVAFGAWRTFGPSLVIDGGTALTLTHVDARGRIHGLGIAPGFGCLAHGLARAAPALARWLAPPEALQPGIARGAAQNLAFGLHEGWRGLVRGLVEAAEARLAAAGLAGTLVWTGTDAVRARESLGRGTLVPGLVHLGLAALAVEHGHGA